MTDTIIEMKGISLRLGQTWVHKNLELSVQRGEILGIVGGSGSGKTTVLREILGLTVPDTGSILIFDQDLYKLSPLQLLQLQRRWGVLFQANALFSSLTVLENIMFPLREHTHLTTAAQTELALLKLIMVGLPQDAAYKYPAELSGGMQKRAGLARAIALDPELLFLDEPTAGLDPGTAAGFDELVIDLQQTMDLTIVMVTHDLDSLWAVTNRVAFLGEGKVLAVLPMPELVKQPHDLIQRFFHGPRGQRAQDSHEH